MRDIYTYKDASTFLQIIKGITKVDYRTIDKGYADCMLLSWGLIWKICDDSKILNSQMLPLVPIIDNNSQLLSIFSIHNYNQD